VFHYLLQVGEFKAAQSKPFAFDHLEDQTQDYFCLTYKVVHAAALFPESGAR
jgi:hypothetical protein